ncbi:30S ribosomal protein S18 [Patescibacteria group bacterium]|nr:30S ribosomal protein S18 [Patescibacteria group bacterium]MCL5797545.1 30S ribosomal protein S18 [Patescibacteria group bacterium]
MLKDRRRTTRRRIIKRKNCFYCKQKIEPDYKDLETLKHGVSDRGKIIGRMLSGICQKHQKALSSAIKRARYIAILPYVVRPS